MPVTDDEMYRQLCADHLHHLQWREKLFGGFLVLIGVLAAAHYSMYTNKDLDKVWYLFLWVIPLVGGFLSFIFAMLDRRCHEILKHRRVVAQDFENQSLRRGVFKSILDVGRDSPKMSHSSILQLLYWASVVAFSGFFIGALICTGFRLHPLYQCFLTFIKNCP